jgi:hypothetical protein
MANDDGAAMTPAGAVARHLEWLEFALAAARDEETRRRDRLGRATDKNRDRRTARLAEVTAEVRELGALVAGLKELRSRPASSTARGAAAANAKTAATANPKTAAMAKPRTPKSKPKTTTAAKAPSRRRSSKPSARST